MPSQVKQSFSFDGIQLQLRVVNDEDRYVKTLALDKSQFLEATLIDQEGLPVIGRAIQFRGGLAELFPSNNTALTNDSGVARIKMILNGEVGASRAIAFYYNDDIFDSYVETGFDYEIVSTLQDNVAIASNGAKLKLSIENNDSSDEVRSISKASSQTIRVTLSDSDDLPIENKKIDFSTELGLLTPSTGSALTNENGQAEISLAAGDFNGATLVTAKTIIDDEILIASYDYEVMSNLDDIEDSLAPNVTRAEDGTVIKLEIKNSDGQLVNILAQDTSQFTIASITDRNGGPISGRKISFKTELGTFEPEIGTALTNENGEATVRILAGRTIGASKLSASIEHKDVLLTANYEFAIVSNETLTNGPNARAIPNNIEVVDSVPHIFVRGVGQTEVSYIKFSVKDANGNTIGEPDDGVNNVRATLVSRPHGGELIHALAANGKIVSSDESTNFIDFSTKGGEATVSLQSGTLPGTVELKIEILDYDGTQLAVPVETTVSQLSISSGPPHSIVLTRSYSTERIENLPGGLYRIIGAVNVTDRWGNPVPDGTVIHLGVMDSIIARGELFGGSTTNGQNTLIDNSGIDFTTTSIYRNFNYRFIEPEDTVFIYDTDNITDITNEIHEGDRRRYVDSIPTLANEINVTHKYLGDNSDLNYLVGASLMGTTVHGTDLEGNEALGYTVTKTGIGDVFMTYSSDEKHIRIGCGPENGTRVTDLDIRHTVPPFDTPDRSADPYVIAKSNETGISTISYPGQFCFAPIAPIHIIPSVSKTTSTTDVRILIHDDFFLGDGVILPYVQFSTNIWYETATDPAFSVTATNCITGVDGTCISSITVVGGNSGDEAIVQFVWGGFVGELSVLIP